MVDLRQKEPLFGKWYIDELISDSGERYVYRIKSRDKGVVHYAMLTHVRLIPTGAELYRLYSMGKTREEILSIYENEAKKQCAESAGEYAECCYEICSDAIGYDLFFRSGDMHGDAAGAKDDCKANEKTSKRHKKSTAPENEEKPKKGTVVQNVLPGLFAALLVVIISMLFFPIESIVLVIIITAIIMYIYTEEKVSPYINPKEHNGNSPNEGLSAEWHEGKPRNQDFELGNINDYSIEFNWKVYEFKTIERDGYYTTPGKYALGDDWVLYNVKEKGDVQYNLYYLYKEKAEEKKAALESQEQTCYISYQQEDDVWLIYIKTYSVAFYNKKNYDAVEVISREKPNADTISGNCMSRQIKAKEPEIIAWRYVKN